jgi:tetratricopeptide (TPR) repeat protein
MNQELIDQFNQYIRESKIDLLLIELKRLRKKKLSLLDRISISDFYDRVSEYYEAFVVLGSKNLSFEASDLKTEDDLLLRAACAQKLANYGAKYTALRMIQVVLEKLELISLDVQTKNRILFYQANIYYSYNFYEKAQAIFEQLVVGSRKHDQHKVLFLLAGCYEAEGRFDKAEKIFQEIIEHSPNSILKAISYLDLGTLYLKQEKLKMARTELKSALHLLDNESGGIDRAYLYKWWGHLLVKEGNEKEGKKYLENSLQLIFRFGHFPHAIYEILYFCSQAKILLSSSQTLTLYTFYEHNRYHLKLLSELEKKENKVAVLSKGELKIVNYHELNRAPNCLDLVGGYFQNNGEKEFLSLINWRCLYALCTSNTQGISKFALTDFVYLDKFVDLNRTVIKLLKLLKPLENFFQLVELKDSIYFCELKNDLQYIVPLTKEHISFERFLKSFDLLPSEKGKIQKCFGISAKVLKKLEERHFL